jgi:hypothetical protein
VRSQAVGRVSCDHFSALRIHASLEIQPRGNRGQNTDSAKILEHIIYGLFFLYTGAPWLTGTYLSFGHTLDFVFKVLSAQHQFLVQGFTIWVMQ